MNTQSYTGAARSRSRSSLALAVCGTAVAVALSTHALGAQGFGLNELGSCAIARGFAATGAPCDDASTLYWNPAATTKLSGISFYGGAAAIKVHGSFAADSTGRTYPSAVPTQFPPFLGLNWTPESHRYAVGVAAYVPYGLTSQWQPDFVGRFSAQKAALKSVYVQPNLAIALVPGRLSIGGGPTFGWSQLELVRSIDLAPNATPGGGPTFAQLGVAPGTEFGRANLEGTATGVGFNLGAHAQLTRTLSLGARYLSKIAFGFDDATATFTQVNTGLQIYPGSPLRGSLPAGTPASLVVPLDNVLATQFAAGGLLAPGQTVKSQIDFPAQLQVGIGYTGFDRTMISVDYALIEWSSFETLPVNFGATSPLTSTLLENYRNSNSVRAGIEHRFGGSSTDMLERTANADLRHGLSDGVAGRLGFAYAQTPAPDESVTPLLPDMNRFNFTAGLGIPLGPTFTLDAAYLRVETEGRRGRVIERTATQTAQQVNGGFYSLDANIFSLSVKARF